MWTAKDVIQSAGYPMEPHIVTTSDGYIMQMERIPRRGALYPDYSGSRVTWVRQASRLPKTKQIGIGACAIVWDLTDSTGADGGPRNLFI